GVLGRTAVSCVFFFSSRRRHTRFSRDWSSDVCSSDLLTIGTGEPESLDGARKFPPRPRLHVTGIGDMDLGAHEKAAVDPEREERFCGGKEGLSLTKSPLSNLDIVRVEVGLVGNELDPELLPGKTGLVLGFAALHATLVVALQVPRTGVPLNEPEDAVPLLGVQRRNEPAFDFPDSPPVDAVEVDRDHDFSCYSPGIPEHSSVQVGTVVRMQLKRRSVQARGAGHHEDARPPRIGEVSQGDFLPLTVLPCDGHVCPPPVHRYRRSRPYRSGYRRSRL